MNEPAEDAKADTDASDVGDYEHYCVAVAFEFVHGFGFSGWNKRTCVGEPHPSVGYLNLITVFISAGLMLNSSIKACLNSSASSLKSKVTELTDSCFP